MVTYTLRLPKKTKKQNKKKKGKKTKTKKNKKKIGPTDKEKLIFACADDDPLEARSTGLLCQHKLINMGHSSSVASLPSKTI